MTISIPSFSAIANSLQGTSKALITLATQGKAATGKRQARVVITSNQSISAFVGVAGGTAQNGVTAVKGNIVFLAGQTTVSQMGPWEVGTVASGTAPLTRPVWWAADDVIDPGTAIEIGPEGTLYAGTSWKAMATGVKVVGTDNPLFYPRRIFTIQPLVAGVLTLGAAHGLWLWSTSKSRVSATYDTPNTITATVALASLIADRTAGVVGTAAASIKAIKADSTVDTANVSTVQVEIVNW